MARRFRFAPFVLAALAADATAADSTCYGTPANGRLENGVALPASGANFRAYAPLGVLLGRTYVHSKVGAAVTDAYAALAKDAPALVFVYGETGFASGGELAPHKTHRNGTSVDFMVPVRRGGASVPLPRTALDRYGYDLEFDGAGRHGDYTIDFAAMAAHLRALHAAARRHGIGIARVIFDVPLQKHLFATPRGAWLKQHVTFSQKPAWVRHDEHYHVDFAVRCRP